MSVMRGWSFFQHRFAPFQIKAYRMLYTAQGFSLVGTWMQELAKSWIVLTLITTQLAGIGKASAMGALLCAAAIPNLLLGGLGGSLADSRGAKKILLYTQLLLAVFALCLGFLVSSGMVNFFWLLFFAFLEGCVVAFDIPAFNIVTPQLVPREHFQQALALNTVNFHLARVLGPSLAGLVMAFGGPATVFWFNAISFLGIVWVIKRLPLAHEQKQRQSSRKAMREVWGYLWNHPLLIRVLLQFVALMSLVFPLIFTTLRVYLQQDFQLSDKEFGLVFAVPGAGALVGSLSFMLTSPKNPLRILPYGVTGVAIFLALLAQAQSLGSAVLLLFAFSVSLFLSLSSLLVTVQLTVEHKIRGRISALVGMAFVSLAPVMSVPIGLLTDRFGARALLTFIAASFALISALLALIHSRRKKILHPQMQERALKTPMLQELDEPRSSP